VLDYLKRTRRVTPAIEAKAREYLSLGNQRLLTFQCADGGFEWWGKGQGVVALTAYGLQEFSAMSGVFDIDPRVMVRAREFLFRSQNRDGSWTSAQGTHGSVPADATQLGLTAYVLWSLLEAGTPANEAHVAGGLSWLAKAAPTEDPSLRALVALARLSADRSDRQAQQLLDELVAGRIQKGDLAHWTGGTSVVSYAGGSSLDIETTATVVLALQKANRDPAVANQALAWLVTQMDSGGTWHSTQATILTLQALLGSAAGTPGDCTGTAVVRVNGRDAARIQVAPENADLMRQVEASELVHAGENTVQIAWEGKPGLMAQVVGRWHVPWDATEGATSAPFALAVAYDRTQVAREERIACSVRAENRQDLDSRMVMVCVGTPPGFQVESADLESLVTAGKVAKFEQNGREVVLYLDRLGGHETVELAWHLQAKFAVEARNAPSRIYEYYAPERNATAPPQEFQVR